MDGNEDRINDLEQANLQLDIEAREAHNARRRAEDMLAEETLKAAAALRALDEYKVANPLRTQLYVNKGNHSANIYSHLSLSLSRLLGMNHRPEIRLASTHDVPRILFLIIQTISGAYSLYKAQGSQIERYGYAALGLAVSPCMMVAIINPIDSLLTSEYETVYPVHSKTMDEMGGRGGLCDRVAGTLENLDHEQYANTDGEAETNYAGSKMQFASSSGRLVCHDVAEVSSHKELQLSESNCIPPVKEVWLAQKWRRQWRDRKKGRKPRSLTSMLCVPSHSEFTRLPPVWYQSYFNLLGIVLLLFALALPYLIIGIL